MIRKRAFLGLLLLAWVPFVVRAVQIYLGGQLPAGRDSCAATAETFREFLEQQGIFVFFVTIYVGAGLIANDRRANALQIYLSKPLTRAEYIAGKLGVLVVVPAARHLGARRMLLLVLQVLFAGNFTFVRAEPVPLPGHHASFSLLQVLVASFTMLALSSLVEEQPLRRHPLRRHRLLHRRRSIGVLHAVTGSTVALVDLADRRTSQQVGDVDLPPPAALLTPVAGLAR